MPWNDIGLAFQCVLAATIQNWDQKRPYTASLIHGREGFTEEWGDDDHATSTSSSTIPEDDENDRNRRLYLEPPLLRLQQYRPAWVEQLVLRVAGLPYRVFNSPYAVHELTGPLPLLQDLSLSSSSSHPAMVGREQNQRPCGKASFASNGSTTTTHYNNSILDYLKRFRSVDLDQALDDEQRQQSVLYTTLIQETLNKLCLYSLRYGDYDDCWEQIYQPQCYRAASPPPHGRFSKTMKRWWIIRPLASFQAWSERRYYMRSNSIGNRNTRSVDQLVATARIAYQALEHQLQKTNPLRGSGADSNTRFSYLLATSSPTVVDCLLWDHLMQALTDVHLVVVLAEFPLLLQLTQHIWDTYHFGVAVDDNTKTRRRQNVPPTMALSSLSVWNWEENALNAFNEVPLLPARLDHNNIGDDNDDGDDDGSQRKRQHAMDLMKKLSVHDLNASLQLVQQLRQDEISSPTTTPPLATWHRWRMGDTLYETNARTRATSEQADSVDRRSSRDHPTSSPDASNTNEQTIRREHQRNDELWLAGVAAMTLTIVLGFGFAGSSR